jgi:WD40 repeat protein
VLDAPGIRDDYYLNLLDWSAQNTLAVALDKSLYLWNATTSDIDMLFEMDNTDADDYITSVSWMADGNILAVGTLSSSPLSRPRSLHRSSALTRLVGLRTQALAPTRCSCGTWPRGARCAR